MLNLGGIDQQTFLRDYWQKKPLLIRQALTNFKSPITPDELAGLACEDGVESRIVIENDKGKPWQVKNGPFDDRIFSKLPKTHWTLLVQGLDYWMPEVSDLLEQFRFIPNWRIDDIMASYAPAYGSVGPHFDYYDVFLLQAYGRRNWKIGQHCTGTEPRVSGTPLRILEHFETHQEWVLEPGDMLYLPPQIAHYGVAQDDCITLSIGFRSPSHQEMLSSWVDYIGERLQEEVHLDDPDLQLQENPGEISPQALRQVEQILASYLTDKERLADWFGRYVTQPKYEGIVEPAERPIKLPKLIKHVNNDGAIRRNEGSRFSFTDTAEGVRFFADGESLVLNGAAAEMARSLSHRNIADASALQGWMKDTTSTDLLLALLNQGSLYLDEPE